MPFIALGAAFVIGLAALFAARNQGEDGRFRMSPPILLGASIMLGVLAGLLASIDTHPKGGNVQQAPAPLSGAVDAEGSETPR